MKKISFAICAMLMLFGNVSAFNGRFFENASKISNHAERVEANIFTTNTVPPMKFVHVPSQGKVIVNDRIHLKDSNFNVGYFNGFKTHGPLNLRSNMSVEEVKSAILTFVGKDTILTFSKGWL